nr:hypothetical protein Iba_chr04bCG17270 [Ipomoea batatas]
MEYITKETYHCFSGLLNLMKYLEATYFSFSSSELSSTSVLEDNSVQGSSRLLTSGSPKGKTGLRSFAKITGTVLVDEILLSFEGGLLSAGDTDGLPCCLSSVLALHSGELLSLKEFLLLLASPFSHNSSSCLDWLVFDLLDLVETFFSGSMLKRRKAARSFLAKGIHFLPRLQPGIHFPKLHPSLPMDLSSLMISSNTLSLLGKHQVPVSGSLPEWRAATLGLVAGDRRAASLAAGCLGRSRVSSVVAGSLLRQPARLLGVLVVGLSLGRRDEE